MATSNQLAYQANKINEARNEETKRANLQNEELKRQELQESKKTQKSQRFANYAQGAGRAAQGVAALKNAGTQARSSMIKDVGQAIGTGLDIIALANEPKWYNNNPAAMSAAGRVSTLLPLGIFQTKGKLSDGEIYSKANPGIVTFKYLPVLPHSMATSTTDPSAVDPEFIRAFQNLYMETRRANSGSRNYEVTNQAQFVLAESGLITLWMEGLRAYKVAKTFSSENRYQGVPLLHALGWSEDVYNNLADFAAYLNFTATMISKNFPVPQNMPWFYRSVWLASNIYADIEDVGHARKYAAIPAAYLKYGDVEFTSKYVARPSDTEDSDGNFYMGYNDFKTLMNDLLNTLLYSEDAGVIAGDLIKAFGDSVIQKFPMADINAQDDFIIGCNDLVRSQFNNATIIPWNNITQNDLDRMAVREEVGSGLFQDLVSAGDTLGIIDTPISLDFIVGNAHKKDCLPEEMAEILMLKALYTASPTEEDGLSEVRVTSCATEVIINVTIHTFTKNNANVVYLTPTRLRGVYEFDFSAGMNVSQATIVSEVMALQEFNKVLPPVIIYKKIGPTSKIWDVNYLSSVAWPFTINSQTYESIKTIAVASLLGI